MYFFGLYSKNIYFLRLNAWYDYGKRVKNQVRSMALNRLSAEPTDPLLKKNKFQNQDWDGKIIFDKKSK
jgi:hypothetical protein